MYSRTRPPQAILNDLGGGVVLGISDDLDSASALGDDVALRHAIGRVVGTFCLDIGAQLSNQGANVFFAEDDDGVHVGEGGQDLGAFFGGHDGTSFAFERTNGVVGIDGNDEASAKIFGSVEITDMAYVQEIKTSIGECDPTACAAPFGDTLAKLIPTQNFCVRCGQWGLVAGGAFSIACNSSCCETVAVPRFITTRPPA